MELIRKISSEEEKLLDLLIKKAQLDVSANWKDSLLVKPMNDGEMGSLKLYSDGLKLDNRHFGKQISDFQFLDVDGVNVIASLNIDTNGDLYELDIWKTDFTSLISIPKFLI